MLQSRISRACEAIGLSPSFFLASAIGEYPQFCSCGHFADAAKSAACKHPFRRGDQRQLFQRKCYLISEVGRERSKDSGIPHRKIFCTSFFTQFNYWDCICKALISRNWGFGFHRHFCSCSLLLTDESGFLSD